MIYLDSSVALSALFAEGRSPAEQFWLEPLTSSRLLEYEVMNRVHARRLGGAHVAAARELIDGIALTDLGPDILSRALDPFPAAVRTLDGLHLATMDFLRLSGQSFSFASYDHRLNVAAEGLGFSLADI